MVKNGNFKGTAVYYGTVDRWQAAAVMSFGGMSGEGLKVVCAR